MKRKHATILMGVVGVLIFCVVVLVAGGAWFFASAFESASADERTAGSAFDDVRRRFSNVGPVFEIPDDGDPVVRRPAPETRPATPLQTLRLRHWGPDDDRMEDVSIPFWLLRLKTGSISVTSRHVGLRDITAEDIERYGPTLLVDHEGRGGDRLLIWTE
jgi:hypothetical protein